jgi:hypothetical protein
MANSPDNPSVTEHQLITGSGKAFPRMEMIPGGSFMMGSNQLYPEEAPAHRVTVDSFWIDRYAVTNADFARFVAASGYVTFAERAPRAEDYPEAIPELLVPGSVVFQKPKRRVDTGSIYNWWAYIPGANWRHPVRRARSKGLSIIPSYMSPSKMLRLMQHGQGSRCRPRPSGSLRRAAESRALNTRGAASTCPAADRWRIPGTGNFHTKTYPRGDILGPFQSVPTRPMVTGCPI